MSLRDFAHETLGPISRTISAQWPVVGGGQGKVTILCGKHYWRLFHNNVRQQAGERASYLHKSSYSISRYRIYDLGTGFALDFIIGGGFPPCRFINRFARGTKGRQESAGTCSAWSREAVGERVCVFPPSSELIGSGMYKGGG